MNVRRKKGDKKMICWLLFFPGILRHERNLHKFGIESAKNRKQEYFLGPIFNQSLGPILHTTSIYNPNAVNIYNATSSLVRRENKIFSFTYIQ
jgi:hypothetical protein